MPLNIPPVLPLRLQLDIVECIVSTACAFALSVSKLITFINFSYSYWNYGGGLDSMLYCQLLIHLNLGYQNGLGTFAN